MSPVADTPSAQHLVPRPPPRGRLFRPAHAVPVPARCLSSRLLYTNCMDSIMNLLQCSTTRSSVCAGYLGKHHSTLVQLSERSLSICRGLTALVWSSRGCWAAQARPRHAAETTPVSTHHAAEGHFNLNLGGRWAGSSALVSTPHSGKRQPLPGVGAQHLWRKWI